MHSKHNSHTYPQFHLGRAPFDCWVIKQALLYIVSTQLKTHFRTGRGHSSAKPAYSHTVWIHSHDPEPFVLESNSNHILPIYNVDSLSI